MPPMNQISASVHSAVGRTASTIVTTVLLFARWFWARLPAAMMRLAALWMQGRFASPTSPTPLRLHHLLDDCDVAAESRAHHARLARRGARHARLRHRPVVLE